MKVRLIADVGGTNARFALAEAGRTGPVTRLAAADYASFEDALGAYLDGAPVPPGRTATTAAPAAKVGPAGAAPAAVTAETVESADPDAPVVVEAAVAAAGPLSDGTVEVTNLPWVVRAAAIAERLGGARVRLFNDLEAVALALPHLGPEEADIRPGTPAPAKPMIAINVGTGFGAAVAAPVADGWTAIACEPGHMSFAASTPEETRLLGTVRSCEDLLSGRGLVWLHHRYGGAAETAEQVFRLAGSDRAAGDAVGFFARYLGRVAGDLVLATGAWGGAWLCGSLLARPHGPAFERAFLAAFGNKGAMSRRLAGVPVRRITTEHPALIGLAAVPIPPEA